nr:RecName: Full=Superoxide dismutase [Mn/Fe] [Bacillus cereus]
MAKFELPNLPTADDAL